MSAFRRGRLARAAGAPAFGEAVEQLVASGGVAIEHIVSGELDEPMAFDQDHDEWVVVLEGSADVEVCDEVFALEPGDWLLLPGGTPHRLLHTSRGTRWLAVHLAER
jgi:cupin 2 domain-containing protein